MPDSFPPPPSLSPPPSPFSSSVPPPPAPRRQRIGLIVTLSLSGGLLAMSAVAALVYTAMDRAAPESLKRLPSSSPAPGGTPSAEALTEEEPAEGEPLAEPTGTGTAPRADISVARCARDSVIGWPEADVKVVNGSGSTADYIVFVDFVDKDGTQVSEGVTTVTGLAPGKSAKSKVQGLGEVPRGTKCRIAEVERTPSNG